MRTINMISEQTKTELQQELDAITDVLDNVLQPGQKEYKALLIRRNEIVGILDRYSE